MNFAVEVVSRALGITRPVLEEKTLPRYVREYLRMVRTQLLILTNGSSNIASPVLKMIVEKSDVNCTWADLFAIEDALIGSLPDNQVYDSVYIWRTRYRQIVGNDLYQEYLSTRPADPTGSRTAELAQAVREDMLSLAARIHYAYAFSPPKEKMRNRLTIINAASIVAVGLAIFLRTFFGENFPASLTACKSGDGCLTYSSLEVVVLAGMIGGFVSVQQRLQSWSDIDPLFKRLEISSGWFSIAAVAPVSGAIFACALYMILFAGVISGGVFPTFAAENYTPPPSVNTGVNFPTFIEWSLPKEPIDWAKLILWCFIAGFAERFVPDVLSRLASAQYATAGSKPTSSS